ncbi:MAG TPA: hypothetical protein PLK67_04250 [Bryobacteraceae bacterium]|nr:hypothetical protein [Bryobacteraceae bacterium]
MPSKKDQKKTTTGKAARRSPSQDSSDTKAKMVTQSTRFTPEQMAIIEEACRAKQWSISQFLLVAAIEKAVAIKNLQQSRRNVAWDARRIARALHGEIPKITYLGKEIGNPDDPYAGWEEDEYRGSAWMRIEDKIDGLYAEYDEGERTISIYTPNLNSEDPEDPGTLICKIAPRAVPGDSVGVILEELETIGSEMVPFIREAYNDFHLRRDGIGERLQLTNPKDLLTDQK